MLDLKVIFEDDSLIAFDKPAGVIVNRAATHSSETLQDVIDSAGYVDSSQDADEMSDFLHRSGLVHRLDKDTSGLILVAKTEVAFRHLQGQFKSRQVDKVYLAVAFGTTPEGKFEINAPLDRNPRNRLKMAVVADGKEAVTEFETVRNFEKEGALFSALKVYPKTGRTHQIRVHLAALKNPIVRDPIYCTKKGYLDSAKLANRMMLHALSITFTHPESKKEINIKTDIPAEFSEYF